MKKIMSIAAATVAILALAIGYQAIAGAAGHEHKPTQQSTQTTPPSAAPGTEGTGDASGSKTDDDQRTGYTEDHQGKPGENK